VLAQLYEFGKFMAVAILKRKYEFISVTKCFRKVDDYGELCVYSGLLLKMLNILVIEYYLHNKLKWH